MLMKRFSIMWCMLAVIFAACTPDAGPDGDDNSTADTPATPELTLEYDDFSFPAEGGSGTILYTLTDPVDDQSVKAECDASWVTEVKVKSAEITFTVLPNEGKDSRSAVLDVSYGEIGYQIALQQAAAADDPDPTPDPAPSDVEEFEAVAIIGEYFGDEATEAYNYYFILYDNMPDDYGYVTAGTKAFIFDVYSDIPVTDGLNIVPAGEYVFDTSDSYAAGTFSSEYSYMVYVTDELEMPSWDIVSGSLTVTENKIEAVIEVEDGKKYHVVYNGIPDMGEIVVESMGNLTGDVTVASDNGYFQAVSYGDYYGIGMNDWEIYLYADGENGIGDSFALEILTEGNSITGSFPYLDYESEYRYDSFISGDIQSESQDYYMVGSWYMNYSEEMELMAYAPLWDGEFVISEKDGIYSFEFDIYDDVGNKIAGTIVAEGDFYDEEGDTLSAAVRKKTRMAGGRNIAAPLAMQNKFSVRQLMKK